ncbi:MAG: oxygenase MpaB family protein [Chloroflexota bacterium]
MGRRTSPGRALTRPESPDPGVYGPRSEAWRFNREAMVLLGAGPRALLLQLAHPAVAAGVDEHSDFRSDPWRRLAGTLRSYLTIVYGTTAAARAEIRRLNELHRSIAGEGYEARDPALSLWVHATLVDSTIAVHDAWIERVVRERRARYYLETRPIGRAFGIPDDRLPPDIDAFEEYVGSMLGPGGEVQVSATARELARTILEPPLAPLAPALGDILRAIPSATYRWTLWPSVGLLPAVVREGYGLEWGPRERIVSAWLVAGWRAWRPWIPESWRWMARARAADARMRSVARGGTDPSASSSGGTGA